MPERDMVRQGVKVRKTVDGMQVGAGLLRRATSLQAVLTRGGQAERAHEVQALAGG